MGEGQVFFLILEKVVQLLVLQQNDLVFLFNAVQVAPLLVQLLLLVLDHDPLLVVLHLRVVDLLGPPLNLVVDQPELRLVFPFNGLVNPTCSRWIWSWILFWSPRVSSSEARSLFSSSLIWRLWSACSFWMMADSSDLTLVTPTCARRRT